MNSQGFFAELKRRNVIRMAGTVSGRRVAAHAGGGHRAADVRRA